MIIVNHKAKREANNNVNESNNKGQAWTIKGAHKSPTSRSKHLFIFRVCSCSKCLTLLKKVHNPKRHLPYIF